MFISASETTPPEGPKVLNGGTHTPSKVCQNFSRRDGEDGAILAQDCECDPVSAVVGAKETLTFAGTHCVGRRAPSALLNIPLGFRFRGGVRQPQWTGRRPTLYWGGERGGRATALLYMLHILLRSSQGVGAQCRSVLNLEL